MAAALQFIYVFWIKLGTDQSILLMYDKLLHKKGR